MENKRRKMSRTSLIPCLVCQKFTCLTTCCWWATRKEMLSRTPDTTEKNPGAATADWQCLSRLQMGMCALFRPDTPLLRICHVWKDVCVIELTAALPAITRRGLGMSHCPSRGNRLSTPWELHKMEHYSDVEEMKLTAHSHRRGSRKNGWEKQGSSPM